MDFWALQAKLPPTIIKLLFIMGSWLFTSRCHACPHSFIHSFILMQNGIPHLFLDSTNWWCLSVLKISKLDSYKIFIKHTKGQDKQLLEQNTYAEYVLWQDRMISSKSYIAKDFNINLMQKGIKMLQSPLHFYW